MRMGMLLGLLMAGCAASSATPVGIPGGGTGFSVECSREASCYEQAGEACPHGYDIVQPISCRFDAMAWTTKSCTMVVKPKG